MTGDLVFYLFAALTVVSGFFVVLSRNIVHAGFALLFTLFGVAGLYAFLGADFLAVTQVMVYIGGVLVLIIFTVMMTRMPRSEHKGLGLSTVVPAAIFAIAVFAAVYRVITSSGWGGATLKAPVPTTSEIGTYLMTNYVFPFEYVSIALLVAMIGAAIVIRERKEAVAEDAALDTPDTLDASDASDIPARAETVASPDTETETAGADAAAGDEEVSS